MNFDPSADFAQVTDGSEPVTLHRRGSTPGSPGVAVAHGLRRAMTVRDVARSNGRYTASDVAWHLPCAELGDAPALGDVIADSQGRRWTILDVQLATQQTRWRCMAREPAIVYGLDDTITILKATFDKGDGGAAQATWQPWKTGVRARIQPMATEIATAHAARQATTQYRIFLAEDVALDHTHRIQGPDGTLYRITRISGAEQLGELQTVETETI
jgi:hypothetical protein